jgi:cysteine synthase
VVLADHIGSRLGHLVAHMHPDHDAAYQVEGIGRRVMPSVCDPEVIDSAERVTDEESFATARRMIREEGLLVGGSSGTAVAAALRVAARGCDGPVVALQADSWDRYLSRPWLRTGE